MFGSARTFARLSSRHLENLSVSKKPESSQPNINVRNIHTRKNTCLPSQRATPGPTSKSMISHTKRYNSTSLSTPPPSIPETEKGGEPSNHDSQSTQGPSRMRIQFKCIAPAPSDSSQIPIEHTNNDPPSAAVEPPTCGHLNTHEFSSQAFHHGIVLVQCPSCLNRHLIADHLQWFTSNRTSDDPNFKDDHRTIIDLMRAKGEAVKRGRVVTSFQSRSSSQSQADTPKAGEVLEFYQ
ncbi:hypothetical protein PTTG_09231 [Puccinia triticina 1-1 BBBD Race 1]|uniref:DNL-type domain-containing protein n=2 Tax=Puccinia triticina TaxID=208348 RepID=A0A0C4F7U7_PUCT1|nr:uncharacterized protein PtA15_11A169 [Puccinia triticina]OAV87237.1 hypothetical protein PTTG_09231 [Puccinia triticina 1-1 BBBD Race 1]WAQ89480.1 hypothetical protein PtA15_11A169 [Puccinia triticina]WAR59535.1 hypothetical protein PtB15_11B175 [Puccinia triticina]